MMENQIIDIQNVIQKQKKNQKCASRKCSEMNGIFHK